MSHFKLKFSTGLVMAASFVLVQMAIVFQNAASGIVQRWGNTFEMTAYLEDGVTSQELNEIETKIKGSNATLDISYISQAESLKQLKADLVNIVKTESEIEDFIDVAPSYFTIKASHSMALEEIFSTFDSIKTSLQTLPSISEVTYGEQWMRKYSKFINLLSGLGILVFSIIGAALLLVISNAVRTSVYSRREQIEILELVGATKWMIRKPFIVEGILTSVASFILATIITSLGVNSINYYFQNDFSYWGILGHISYLSGPNLIGLLLLSIAIGGFGSYISLRSINSGWAAAQRPAP